MFCKQCSDRWTSWHAVLHHMHGLPIHALIFAHPAGSHCWWKLCHFIACGHGVLSHSASVFVYPHSSQESWSIDTLNWYITPYSRSFSGIFQVLFFARIHDNWGLKKTFVVGIVSAILAFILLPVSNTLAWAQGYSTAVWIATGLQCIPGIYPTVTSTHNLQAAFFSDKLML